MISYILTRWHVIRKSNSRCQQLAVISLGQLVRSFCIIGCNILITLAAFKIKLDIVIIKDVVLVISVEVVYIQLLTVINDIILRSQFQSVLSLFNSPLNSSFACVFFRVGLRICRLYCGDLELIELIIRSSTILSFNCAGDIFLSKFGNCAVYGVLYNDSGLLLFTVICKGIIGDSYNAVLNGQKSFIILRCLLFFGCNFCFQEELTTCVTRIGGRTVLIACQ